MAIVASHFVAAVLIEVFVLIILNMFIHTDRLI